MLIERFKITIILLCSHGFSANYFSKITTMDNMVKGVILKKRTKITYIS